MSKKEYKDGISAEKLFMHSLYIEFIGLMVATAKKYESNSDEIDDIIQDSLLKLIPKISILKEMERCILAAYVVSTVRNTAINHVKKKHNTMKYNVKDEISDIPENALPLDELLILREKKKCLMQIWEILPEDDRILLEGKYILGYTDTELANELKIKPSSIRMKLTRARRRALNLMINIEGDN